MSTFTQLPASDFMSKAIISVEKNMTLELARKILIKNNIHHLLVLETDKYVGLLSSNDLIRSEPAQISTLKAEDVMAKDIFCIPRNATIEDAIKLFYKYECNSLPIVDGDNVVGILTSKDILKSLLEQ